MNIYTTILIEFLFLSASILLLFRFRSKLGLAPLYILLGAIQYLQAFSNTFISFEILGEYTIYPSPIIIFSGVLFAVLLIYIKEGVASARTLIVGIIISNFLLSAFSGIAYLQGSFLELINENSTKPIFSIDYKYFITGTLILLLDFILLVILYQFLITKIKKLYFFLILFLSLESVLIFDSLVFNLILKYNDPEFITALIGHIIGKTLATFIFSLILYIYLKHIDKEKKGISFIANQNKDIFSILRYRVKYKNLKIRKEQVEKKLVSQLEATLNNISDGFVSLDTNWCYTYVNIKAGEFLGRAPESLIGKHIWTEFPEGVGLPFYNVYYKAVETQKTQYFIEYYEPFGKWFENRIYPSSDGLTIYFTDITERKEAEKNNQMLLSLIETSDDFIGLASLEGKPIYLNALGNKMVGLEVDEELPTNIAGFFPEDYLDTIVNVHMPNIFNKGKWNGEAQFKNLKTGGLIPIEMSGFLIKDSISNKPLALGVVATNITKRKAAESLLIKSEKYLDNIINNVGDPIFVKDDQSRLLLVNEAFCKIFNLTRADVIGKTLAEDVTPEERESFLRIDKQVLSTGVENINEESLTVRGEETRIISTKKTRFIDDDANTYLIGIIRDITERKKTEDEITKYKNHLEELVELRTNQLAKETIRAQSADLMKSAFLATMSHELRTPMNSIIGFTGILLKEFAGPINEEQKKQLSMVKNSGQHLLGLINDVLDISKIEAGKLKVSKSPFSYLTTLEKTIEFLSPQAIKKGLQISLEYSATKVILNSDERRVEQVLLNLISNAIKFSNHGTILVKVDRNNNVLTTQIIDQGIGVSKKDLNKLFMPFIQLHNGLSRKHDGTGLGLSICKNLIEKLGGTITVTSKIGVGSNFTFNLPLEQVDNK